MSPPSVVLTTRHIRVLGTTDGGVEVALAMLHRGPVTTYDYRRQWAAVARGQHGVVTRQQLNDFGMSVAQIRGRLDVGELVWAAPRTFIVAGSANSVWQNLSVAVLSRPKAILSGRSAAWMHGFAGVAQPTEPEITVPASASGRCPVAAVRRSQHYGTISTVTIQGLPTADEVETVFRIAHYVAPHRIAGFIDSILIGQDACVEQLGDVYLRHQGERMKGMAALRPLLLERLSDSYVPDESQLETLADAVLDEVALPAMIKQAPIPWAPNAGRVDRLIPDWRLIIELDGRRWHTRTDAFEVDRARDNAAAANGYSVLRFTWSMLQTEPERCRRLVVAVGARQSRLSA